MPSSPRLLQDNRTWALDVDANDIPNLAIPGLKAATRNRDGFPNQPYVYGYIDAVAAACRVVGVEPPSPREPAFAMPEGNLRQYQQDGVRILMAIQRDARGAILADEMGLGKSRQAITLAKVRGCKRVVIVTPGRARYTWVEELEKAGERMYALMLPKGAKGWKLERAKVASARWVITSYDLLPEVGSPYPSMLIIDECHEVKNSKAQRSQQALSMARMVPYRLGISATPAWNTPRDWWFILDLLLPGRFGRKHDFEARYADGHQGTYGWVAKGVSNAEELRTRLSYYLIRREKRDVAQELPPMTDVPVWLEPDASATAAMRACALKVPGCSFYDALLATLEAKLQPCVELAHSAKRFLLFTWQKAHAGIMSNKLNEEGTPNVLIHGEMSDAARANAIALARAKGIGIVATIDSAGQSLNLQGVASYGIFHCQDAVPFKMIQARSRLHRLGITDPVTWAHVLLKDSADEVVWRRSTSKLMAQEASMPAMQDAAAYREAMNVQTMDDQEALAAYYAEMNEMVEAT